MNYASLKSFFNQPYSLFESKSNRLVLSLGICCFVWFILFSFGIFDLSYFSVLQRFYITGVYSLCELLTLLLNSFIVYKHVIKKATYSTTAIWSLWLIFCIGVANFLVTTIVFEFENITLLVFIKNQIYTIILGLIIIPFALLIHYNFKLKQKIVQFEIKHFEIAKSDSVLSDTEKVLLKSEYSSDSFEIDMNRILFIKSADNYIDVCYTINNKISHKLIRNTLSAIEKMCIHQDLVRCHRSYIVNRRKILSMEGNGYGYALSLDGFNQKIPISRKQKKEILFLKK